MANLYNDELASTYDAMYQGFIDYTKEYKFYASLCARYNSKTILEIACGSGNLAKPFSQNFNSYTGLDLSDAMLNIAQKKHPMGTFLKGDMRDFKSSVFYDSILITGRSTSYLLSDVDVLNTFDSVYNTLEPNGVFIFDFIDAERFIPFVKANKHITHKSEYKGKHYFRKSQWVQKTDSNLIDWNADYYSVKKNKNVFLGNDTSTFRCFSSKEILLFLSKKGFKVVELVNRKTYAFDTYVVVCKKI